MNYNLRITVIIVTWNSQSDIERCLHSVFQSTIATQLEVIVVDNHSSDSTVSCITNNFPLVRLICSQENSGFSKANNLALSMVSTEYILLLNPDTVVLPTSIEHMLTTLVSDSSVSLVGPRLILPSGRTQPESARAIPTLLDYFFLYSLLTMIGYTLFQGRIFCRSYLGRRNVTDSRPVPAISGAAMMFSLAAFQQVGYLDEQFFFGGEDLDYCMRFGNIGNVFYDSQASIKHYQGSSMKQSLGQASLEMFFSDWMLYEKYHPGQGKKFQLLVKVVYLPRIFGLAVIDALLRRFSVRSFIQALKNYTNILLWTSPRKK